MLSKETFEVFPSPSMLATCFIFLLLEEEEQEEKDEACGKHNVWRGVKIMKLIIMQYSLSTFYLFLLSPDILNCLFSNNSVFL